MGAKIMEHEDVPEIAERGGLFYFSRRGKEVKAYRPNSLLLLKQRIDAAYHAWERRPAGDVVTLPKH